VNGVWVGVHREPQQLVSTLRALRRQLDINTEVGGVFWVVFGLVGVIAVPAIGQQIPPLINTPPPSPTLPPPPTLSPVPPQRWAWSTTTPSRSCGCSLMLGAPPAPSSSWTMGSC